jgi:hypothetical protein
LTRSQPLYHLIDETHPTLLIDEADNLGIALRPNGRLRAVFNSGHRRGGTVAIIEHGATRKFSTHAPLALALPEMRGLPRTLNSRSITISMQRSPRRLKRFDTYRPDLALEAAYQQIRLWQREVELDDNPELPEGMRNRFADNWRCLISIADSLSWGDEAREAMLIFAREHQDADIKILALVDIRKAFDASKLDRMPTRALLTALHAMDDAEWTEFRGPRGDQQPHQMRATELATMLRDFEIRPHTIWPANRTATSTSAKGYRRMQFEEAWRRYCADDGTTAQPSNVMSLRAGGGGTT